MVQLNNITLISNNTTLSSTNNVYIVDATNNDVTATLPLIICDGINFVISRIDSSNKTVSITTQGGSIINYLGATASAISLLTQTYMQIVSYRGDWYGFNELGITQFPPYPNDDFMLV